jgi:hypothetical protein
VSDVTTESRLPKPRHTGAQVDKRQVEEMSVRAAADFELFYAERRESGEIEEHTRRGAPLKSAPSMIATSLLR